MPPPRPAPLFPRSRLGQSVPRRWQRAPTQSVGSPVRRPPSCPTTFALVAPGSLILPNRYASQARAGGPLGLGAPVAAVTRESGEPGGRPKVFLPHTRALGPRARVRRHRSAGQVCGRLGRAALCVRSAGLTARVCACAAVTVTVHATGRAARGARGREEGAGVRTQTVLAAAACGPWHLAERAPPPVAVATADRLGSDPWAPGGPEGQWDGGLLWGAIPQAAWIRG